VQRIVGDRERTQTRRHAYTGPHAAIVARSRGRHKPEYGGNTMKTGSSHMPATKMDMHEMKMDQTKLYVRFAIMIATSTIVMFGLMYLNTYERDHVFFSQTRAWMALLMGATMAVIMLAFMRGMYRNARVNVAIYGASIVTFALSLWLVRSQATVSDVSWMKGMIPHHSIAILTSERAHITDPRVRALADGIITAQRREIGEMKALITDLETSR
jgi:uncharacterized protein (DUF305 family)